MHLPALNPRGEATGGKRSLDGHGRQHVSPEGSQGRRALPGHDARRDHDRDRLLRAAQLQAIAADLVPDSDQVSRRAEAEVWPAARAAVLDEGCVLVRHRRDGAEHERSPSMGRSTGASLRAADWSFSWWKRTPARWVESASQEFMLSTEAGEDLIASCPLCGRYAANVEKAISTA